MCAMVNGKEHKECMSLLESTVHEQCKRMSNFVPIHLKNKVREHHGTNNGKIIVYSMSLVSTVMYISCTVLLSNCSECRCNEGHIAQNPQC